MELDTSQNAHPQSISTLGVCTARYESKCSPSKYPETWCLWSSIRVKMLTLKVFRHLASVQLDTSQNAHPQSILKLGVCTARYKSKCSTSKYPDTWRLWSWIRVKNAHPQSISTLGVCTARYESKCSPSKYLETWRLWSSIRVKMLTLKVFRHESKYPDTRRLWSSIRVKMLTLKVSRHLASVQLDTSQNAHPQSILKLGVCGARYE